MTAREEAATAIACIWQRPEPNVGRGVKKLYGGKGGRSILMEGCGSGEGGGKLMRRWSSYELLSRSIFGFSPLVLSGGCGQKWHALILDLTTWSQLLQRCSFLSELNPSFVVFSQLQNGRNAPEQIYWLLAGTLGTQFHICCGPQLH